MGSHGLRCRVRRIVAPGGHAAGECVRARLQPQTVEGHAGLARKRLDVLPFVPIGKHRVDNDGMTGGQDLSRLPAQNLVNAIAGFRRVGNVGEVIIFADAGQRFSLQIATQVHGAGRTSEAWRKSGSKGGFSGSG